MRILLFEKAVHTVNHQCLGSWVCSLERCLSIFETIAVHRDISKCDRKSIPLWAWNVWEPKHFAIFGVHDFSYPKWHLAAESLSAISRLSCDVHPLARWPSFSIADSFKRAAAQRQLVTSFHSSVRPRTLSRPDKQAVVDLGECQSWVFSTAVGRLLYGAILKSRCSFFFLIL